MYWALWLFCSRCRTRYLSLLKFILLINSTTFSTSGWTWAGLKQAFQVSKSTANDKAISHQCNLWDEECRTVFSSFRLSWFIQGDQVWKHTFNLPLLFNNFCSLLDLWSRMVTVSILPSHTVSPTILWTDHYQGFKFMIRIGTIKFWLPEKELLPKLLNLQHDP